MVGSVEAPVPGVLSRWGGCPNITSDQCRAVRVSAVGSGAAGGVVLSCPRRPGSVIASSIEVGLTRGPVAGPDRGPAAPAPQIALTVCCRAPALRSPARLSCPRCPEVETPRSSLPTSHRHPQLGASGHDCGVLAVLALIGRSPRVRRPDRYPSGGLVDLVAQGCVAGGRREPLRRHRRESRRCGGNGARSAVLQAEEQLFQRDSARRGVRTRS